MYVVYSCIPLQTTSIELDRMAIISVAKLD